MRYLLFMAPLVLTASFAANPVFGTAQMQEDEGHRPNTHSSASEFVDELDADGDQKISEQEYLDAAKEWFSKWDLDADGYISPAELQRVIEFHERRKKGANEGM